MLQDEDLAKEWTADINESVNDISCRPRTLLVIVNPWGGNGRANKVWSREAYPIMSQAGTSLLSAMQQMLIFHSVSVHFMFCYRIKWLPSQDRLCHCEPLGQHWAYQEGLLMSPAQIPSDLSQ